MQKYFNVNSNEMVKFVKFCHHQHPKFKDAQTVSVMDGWTTVFVPHWVGTVGEFYWMVSKREPKTH
jgi:hypothetical protein